MKTLRFTALFFALAYAIVLMHYLSFDHRGKEKKIEESALRMKYVEPSFCFKEKEYKEFAYVQ
ncbi:MAG TPA: hypothetical protein CFH80_02855 [Sulfurospirillum cavolei]|uniref:Uncharacterized protein n=1 Tax=Sulfurospirillum cavolei TaxID=366522 RepID=A0A2D3WCL3_9BACT|nr:hypothetical protein [Sulfurospirillum cavolei]DAB36820.1 MAG TPA: hypothetical protein CFH80_02855 [Sulfurospirillum cavolei]